ncbi:MAG: hypothetical protein JXQ73_13590 [Phycisphaerae bacterium]|nr:hypothetical protein [Phycisphaerae bacterium]
MKEEPVTLTYASGNDRKMPFAFWYGACALLVTGVAVLRAILFGALGPPPLVIGLAYGISGGHAGVLVLVAGAMHLIVFLLANAYLYVGAREGRHRSGLRAGLVSLLYTGLLFGLSLVYWTVPIVRSSRGTGFGGIEAALRVQGATYVWSYGCVNILGFLAAAFALVTLMRRRTGPKAWLAYNTGLHLSLFVFVWPWLGGYG